MNDYDKAGRYLVKRDPTGFLCWLLGIPQLRFQGWIDARRVVLPKQDDLINDLVAAVQEGEALEGICLELEAAARADIVTRLLRYLAELWSEPAGPQALPISCVSGVILDLTGRSRARSLSLRSVMVPSARLELSLLRRHLVDEDAATVVAQVASGALSPWLLGWVPLMRNGDESGIIASWREEALRRFPNERDRADLGLLTTTMATLARCQSAWNQGLRGWAMKTSPLWDEIRAEGRAEGRVEGRAEGARATLLHLGRQKFRKAPNRKQQKELESITDLEQLESLAARLLEVDSWSDLLNGHA